MFRFSWKRILTASDNSYKNCFLIVKMLVNREIPKNRYDPIYKFYGKNYHGLSFLSNPQELLYYSYKYSYKELAQYIALASYRCLAEYKIYNTLTLNLKVCPVEKRIILNNRLLIIDNTSITFIYEK